MEKRQQNSKGMVYIKHLILACLITAVLLLLSAFFMYKTNMSNTAVSILLVATYILSNLIAGWRMGKSVEKRQFLWGMFIGLGYFAMVMLVSFVGNQFFMADLSKILLVFFLCVLSGLFGGMVS